MLFLFLGLALVAQPATKVEPVPKASAPKVDLKLPDVPKVDELSRPSKPAELEAKPVSMGSTPTEVAGVASVASVTHAKDFVVAGTARRPVGRIDGFSFPKLPGRVAPFKSCIRVQSTSGAPVVLRASIRSPAGNELLSSRAEVTFGAGQVMDVVVDWEGFQVAQAGEYKLAVTLDGKPPAEFALPVKAK